MNQVACPLHVTEEELKQLTAAAAVCLCEWENAEGERWGELQVIGSLQECQEECKSVEGPRLFPVVPVVKGWGKTSTSSRGNAATARSAPIRVMIQDPSGATNTPWRSGVRHEKD